MKKTAKRLVKHFAGSLSDAPARRKTAEALQVHQETIRLWLHNGIPLERALWVEQKTGGAITADEILREARKVV